MLKQIVLETKNIWKKIGHHVIVNDVSFNLKEGEILGFIGPNGAGKTTTIKLILGLQLPNGGEVKIAGYDLKNDFVKAISNVGAIIENPDLYMYMSGYENLKIAAKLHNIPISRILEVVKLVGLENRIHDKVKKYSLGMKQRLGIAQAIIHKPKLLILDEPMNGLDPEGIKDLKVLLKKLAKEENMAILISSHLLNELENICNSVCIMINGKIIRKISMSELKEITEKDDYILEVSKVTLHRYLYDFKIIDNNHIKINTTKENISNILKTLLLNDIEIYGIRKETTSLEEFFLSVAAKDEND